MKKNGKQRTGRNDGGKRNRKSDSKKPNAAAESRPRGMKSSRPGTTIQRSAAAGPKADQKRAAEEREQAGVRHTAHEASRFLRGQRIDPRRIDGQETVIDLIDGTFLAYNAARLREACQLFTQKMLEPDVTIGMTLTGALTPAGLGCSSIVPLIKAGFVDWIVSTGAILYHDMHFALNYPIRQGDFRMDDTELRDK